LGYWDAAMATYGWCISILDPRS